MKKKSNVYYQENDYMVCICNDDIKIKVDIDMVEKMQDLYWGYRKGRVYSTTNGQHQGLAQFIMGSNFKGEKILFNTDDHFDYRRKNLYTGNTYTLKDNYYIGKCYKGYEFLIDVEDYDLVKPYKWHVDPNGYVITKIDNIVIKQHRMVLGLKNNDPREVDHINHNQLDNRKSKLRIVNRSQNCMNTRIGSNNKSGIKGVYKPKGFNKWCVQIQANGKKQYLGSYEKLEDAISVRSLAEKELHGEYACNNIRDSKMGNQQPSLE